MSFEGTKFNNESKNSPIPFRLYIATNYPETTTS